MIYPRPTQTPIRPTSRRLRTPRSQFPCSPTPFPASHVAGAANAQFSSTTSPLPVSCGISRSTTLTRRSIRGIRRAAESASGTAAAAERWRMRATASMSPRYTYAAACSVLVVTRMLDDLACWNAISETIARRRSASFDPIYLQYHSSRAGPAHFHHS